MPPMTATAGAQEGTGLQHAIDRLDSFNTSRVHAVDAKWTHKKGSPPTGAQKNSV